MHIPLIARTVVLVAWSVALLVHAGPAPRAGALVLAMALIWAAPLLRDGMRARARRAAPTWRMERSRPA